MEGNGKAVEIAVINEKLRAFKEDFEEHKKAERDYGIKTDLNVKDLYEKNRQLMECIGTLRVDIKVTMVKVGAIIGIATIVFSGIVGAIARLIWR